MAEKLKEFFGRNVEGEDFDAGCKRVNLMTTDATTQAVVRSVAVGESNIGTATLELNGIPQGNAVTSEGTLIVDNNSTLDLVLDDSFYGSSARINYTATGSYFVLNNIVNSNPELSVDENIIEIQAATNQDVYYPLKLVGSNLYLTSENFDRVYRGIVSGDSVGTISQTGVGTNINSASKIAFDGEDSVYSIYNRVLYRFDLSTETETALYTYTSAEIEFTPGIIKYANGFLFIGATGYGKFYIVNLADGTITKKLGTYEPSHTKTSLTFDGDYYHSTAQTSATNIQKISFPKEFFESQIEEELTYDWTVNLTLPTTQPWFFSTLYMTPPLDVYSTKFLVVKSGSSELFIVDTTEDTAVNTGLLIADAVPFVVSTPIIDPTLYPTKFEIGVYGVEITEE